MRPIDWTDLLFETPWRVLDVDRWPAPTRRAFILLGPISAPLLLIYGVALVIWTSLAFVAVLLILGSWAVVLSIADLWREHDD